VTGWMLYGGMMMLGWMAWGHEGWVTRVRAQGWIRQGLAVTAVLLAGWAVYWGMRTTGRGTGVVILLALGGLMLSGLLGRLSGLQVRVNRLVARAALDLTRRGDAVGLKGAWAVGAMLGLNPAGWMAALLAGWTGDVRWMAWKVVVDAVTLWGLAPGRVQGSIWVVIGVTIFQGGLEGLARWSRAGLERVDGLGVAVVTTGVVWLTIPLLVLGLRRVPLANLSLAGVLAGALVWAWARG